MADIQSANNKPSEEDKYVKQRIDLTPNPTEEQQNQCKEAREWRNNFMDGHNQSPGTLASNMYPNGVKIANNKEYIQYAAKGKEQDWSDDANLLQALANRFISDMQDVGLEVCWIRSRKDHWLPSLKGKVEPQRWVASGRIQFYCVRCTTKNNDKTQSQETHPGLLANGIFKKQVPKTKVKAKASKGQFTAYRDYTLHLEEIYYHSCNCKVVQSEYFSNYSRDGYVVIPVPFNFVFKKHYNPLRKILDDYDKAGFYLSKAVQEMPDDKQKELRQSLGIGPREVAKPKDQKRYEQRMRKYTLRDPNKSQWCPLGELIDYQSENYEYDDRQYMLLPGYPFDEDLHWKVHKTSMARLLFVIICQLGIEVDAAPFLLDDRKFCDQWEKGTASKNAKKCYRNCFKLNEKKHIDMKGVSVLFGGNEREVAGMDPIHQYCHFDRGSKPIKMPDTNCFVPGSFMVPLSEEGRSLYIRNPGHIVHIQCGEILLFKGDLPHGGITRRNDNGRQNVAIHGHLDSKHHKEDTTLLSLSRLNDLYFVKEHLVLFHVSDHIQHILEQFDLLRTMVEHFQSSRADELQEEVAKLVDSEPQNTHSKNLSDVFPKFQAVRNTMSKTSFCKSLSKQKDGRESSTPSQPGTSTSTSTSNKRRKVSPNPNTNKD